MAIAKPAQAAGYSEWQLTSAVLGFLRFIRDNHAISSKPRTERVKNLDSAITDFASHCGVAPSDFRDYVGNIMQLE